jgi:tryptophan synthase alpha chain
MDMVARFRERDPKTPIVLMGYLNSVERMGYREFVERAAKAGVDGLIVVNLPPEEAGELRQLMLAHRLDLIFLVAPTSTGPRIASIAAQASFSSFAQGVTGATTSATRCRRAGWADSRTYGAAGHGGVRDQDADTARAIAELADGVVIGTILVTTMERHRAQPELIPGALQAQVATIRTALDR